MWCVSFWKNGVWVGNSLLERKCESLPLDGRFLTPPTGIHRDLLKQIAQEISNFSWYVSIDTKKHTYVAIASGVETSDSGLGQRHFSQNPEIVAWVLFRERQPRRLAYWATLANRHCRNIHESDLNLTALLTNDRALEELRCSELAEAFGVPLDHVAHIEIVRPEPDI